MYFAQFIDSGGHTTTPMLLDPSIVMGTGMQRICANDGAPRAIGKQPMRNTASNCRMVPPCRIALHIYITCLYDFLVLLLGNESNDYQQGTNNDSGQSAAQT
jgi:hypothetical protein